MCTQPHPNCLESISSCFATIHVRADKYDNKIEKFFVEYEELGHRLNRDSEKENHESTETVS